jgi:hypothetical protein
MCCFLFLLSLFEVHHGNMIRFGKTVDRLHIGIADSAECRRGGDRILALPPEKRAYISHGLKLGYVRLEKDAVNGAAAERHVIPE